MIILHAIFTLIHTYFVQHLNEYIKRVLKKKIIFFRIFLRPVSTPLGYRPVFFCNSACAKKSLSLQCIFF